MASSIHVAVAAAVLMVAAYQLQFYLIYPSNFPSGSRSLVDKPDQFGMEFEDIKLKTPDGYTIHLYVIPSVRMGSSKTVLLLGPNAGNIGNALPSARRMHHWGYNVVLLSYRGYGLSTGSPSESGLKMDLDTTLKFISEHPKIHGTKLILYGRSLGGAVAIYGAARSPYRDTVDAVILENTFTSIPRLVPSVIPIFKYLTVIITQRWESYKLVPLIPHDLPMLFMAGGDDELIPPRMFTELYKGTSSERKTYNLYPRGMHNDTILQPGYWDDILAFLTELPPKRRVPQTK